MFTKIVGKLETEIKELASEIKHRKMLLLIPLSKKNKRQVRIEVLVLSKQKAVLETELQIFKTKSLN